MEKMKLGAITIGQSPRVDVTFDVAAIFGERVELLEFGALDELSRQEALALRPLPGDYLLTTRLRDGTEVHISAGLVIQRMQAGIRKLEEAGCRLIMMFCTGDFTDSFTSRVPLVEPSRLLRGIVPHLTASGSVVIMPPSVEQCEQTTQRWQRAFPNLRFIGVPASPYGGQAARDEAAERIAAMPEVDLVVMDCIGFSVAMRDRLQARTGKNVVLPRTLLCKICAELVGG